MRVFLLDTNVLVFAGIEPRRLSSGVTDVISAADTTLLVSAITAFEVATKHKSGKLTLPPSELLNIVDDLSAKFVPIEHDTGAVAGALEWSNRDPWDRMIAAQAMASEATLISSDAAFDALDGLTRLW